MNSNDSGFNLRSSLASDIASALFFVNHRHMMGQNEAYPPVGVEVVLVGTEVSYAENAEKFSILRHKTQVKKLCTRVHGLKSVRR